MSRRVRMVPLDWQHPIDPKTGEYIPLLAGPAAESLAWWDEGAAQWEKGLVCYALDGVWRKRPEKYADWSWTEYAGERPSPGHYMPEFEQGTATHYMMYETTTEGTPFSPAFATPEQLAEWLSYNNVSAFGAFTASYDEWLYAIRNDSGFSLTTC